MEKIKIRAIDTSDIHSLQEISKQTFEETFSSENDSTDMAMYLSSEFSLSKLELELNNKNSKYYFAELNDLVVGYLKLNLMDSQTEIKEDKGIEIERIYVKKEFQGKKIGQVLYDKALEIAKAKNMEYIWLGVWEKNTKAIHFYEKNGFFVFDSHSFKLGNDIQKNLLMKRIINKNPL